MRANRRMASLLTLIVFLLILMIPSVEATPPSAGTGASSWWEEMLGKAVAFGIIFLAVGGWIAFRYWTTPRHLRLIEAVKHGDDYRIRAFLEKGASPNAQDPKHGGTALHWAVLKGNIQIVELLLKNGANSNAKNKLGETPLHVAAAIDRPDICDALIAKGARITEEDGKGQTPLFVAVEAGNNKATELLRRHAERTFGKVRNA